MQHKITKQLTTKKGAASFYVVIFTTLIVGVITLSFIRIMLDEATRTTDTDLSQSAYDSALAGVEDAKAALIKCHRQNKEKPAGDSTDYCAPLMGDCNAMTTYLYNRSDKNGEVQISENNKGTDSSELQAYTCVKIKDTLEDYRATLTSNVHIKVIPLAVRDFGTAKKVRVSWYSAVNGANKENLDKLQAKPDSGNLYFGSNGVARNDGQGSTTAPLMTAELVQTDMAFNFDDLLSDSNGGGTDRSLMALYPVRGSGITTIRTSDVVSSGTAESINNPYYISCNTENEFACNAEIELPNTLGGGARNSETAFLIITAPYNNMDVDFAVTVLNGEGRALQFQGAQYGVDSTGRANDIYRRIDTRVELGNANYPYPEYVSQSGALDNDTNAKLRKNFWATADCHKTRNEFLTDTDPYDIVTCANSGELKP